ncbi:MAG: ferredoxin [Anaerosomatales bacterium]|nr:ferredoxin [Anaerosomatales bacterium]
MKPTVDRALCIGCRLCEDTCPDVFRIDEGGLAYVLRSDPPHELYGDVKAAAEICPTNAISIEPL